MTVYVKDLLKSVLSGLSKMKGFMMIADYADFIFPQVGYYGKDEADYVTILIFGTVKSTLRLSVTIVLYVCRWC